MRFEKVALAALAYVEPPEVVTSDEVEERLAPLYKRLRLPQGRLELMTGIRERRFWPVGTLPSTIAASAGKAALQQWGGDPVGIDLLIHSSVCRDRLEPATAAYVHGNLGLPATTQTFDISNACLGFLNAMVTAAGLIESGQIRNALIVSGENGKPLLERTLEQLLSGDYTRQSVKPFFANLTIGAGAVATVMSHVDACSRESPRLTAAVSRTDSAANRLCQGDAAGSDALEMQTDSEALLEAGVALAKQCWQAFCQETDWSASGVDRVVCHQVGRQHQRALLQALAINEAKDVSTYATHGNAGSVSCPMTLAHGLESGAIQRGDRVALLGIGSGLCSLMQAIEC